VRSLAALGVADPYEQQLIMAGGMFQTPNRALRAAGIHHHLGAAGDTTLFEAERREFQREFGIMPIAMQAVMFGRQLGVNANVALAMLQMQPADVTKTGKYLHSIGMHLGQVNAPGTPVRTDGNHTRSIGGQIA